MTETSVEFQIQKVGIGETWPRLTENQQKPAWLKIDFDRFFFEDSEDSEEDENALDVICCLLCVC